MKIVIVDDDFWIRDELSDAIRQISSTYEIVGMAENGQEGLELIRSQRPDLVITDIQMPVMDGLTMLSFVRAEQIACKVLILSDHVDFDYARRAITLNVLGYLYKPDVGDKVIEEFMPILGNIERMIQKEKGQEQFWTLDHVFLNSITGQLEDDRKVIEFIEERYGIYREEVIGLYKVTMRENYKTYDKMVRHMLQDVGMHEKCMKFHLLELPYRHTILMILYHIGEEEELYQYYKNVVTPMLSNEVQGELLCSWGYCRGLLAMQGTLQELEVNEEWNLLLGRGHMISQKEIAPVQGQELKYPYFLESYIKEALLHNRKEEYMKTLRKYRQYCIENKYTPSEIKEIMTRCFFNILYISMESGKIDEMPPIRGWIKRIDQALYWSELREDYLSFFEYIQKHAKEETEYSVMIQSALSLITEYYDQGITLGEIAKQLCVTDTYLSTQLKKETGKTFTEIVRERRIPMVKQLLLETSLKLTEIANRVGYADAKYMSKVFKEEVGMLPAEYRKKNNILR